jgi:tetratricopeptide (TPR) repeat protein
MAEYALELAKLTDSLRIAEGMWVAFAVVEDYPTRQALITELRLRLEGELALREVHLSAAQPDLYDALQATPGAGERAAYCVYGFEELSGAARRQAMTGLNIRRETLRALGHPLILWLTGENLASLARTAPDFYAWRSALYEFGAAQLPDGARASPIPHMLGVHSRSLIPPQELRKRAELYRQRIRELQAEASPNLAAIGGFQHQLGDIHDELGEWDEALDFYRRSLEIKERLGDQAGAAQTLNNIGLIYANKGEWDEALDFYRRSLEMSERLGDRVGASNTWWNIGLVHEQQDDLEGAIEWLARTVEFEQRIGHPDAEKDAAYLEEVKRKDVKRKTQGRKA